MPGYGAMGFGVGSVDQGRNDIAAALMRINQPPPVPPMQAMAQATPSPMSMPQAQTAATQPANPPIGPMGTGIGGPFQQGLNLPGLDQSQMQPGGAPQQPPVRY